MNANKMNVTNLGKNVRNLATLRKIDPSIEEISIDASHTCVRQYDGTIWKKYGVEVHWIT